MLWQDVRAAARGIGRRPGFSAAIVAVFAIAICANTTVFALAHAWMIRALPFPDAGELVVLDTTVGATRGNLSGREVRDLPRDSRLIADLAAFYPSQYNLTGGGPPEALTCIISTHNLFRVLGVGMLHGDVWSASSDWTEQYLVALGYDVWARRFGGDPGVAGRTIIMDGAPYAVTGVVPRGFAFPQRVDVFRAVTAFNAEGARRYSAVARLRPGIAIADVQAELDALGRQYEQAHPTTNRGVRFHVRSLRDSYIGPVRPYIWLLAGAVGLVLLISGANVINLYLVRAVGRRQEVAIRTALGAERWRIVAAFVTESVLLAGIGGALGVSLASVVLALLPRFTALDLPPWMATGVDLPVLLFATGLSLVIGLVTGAAAAFGAVSSDSPEALRSNIRGSTGTARQRRTRAALMTAQVALAVAVLLGAGLTMKSFARLSAVDLGLQPEHLITFRMDPPWKKYPELSDISLFYERTLERLSTLPGVTGVAANHKLPLSGLTDITQTVNVEGQERAQAMPFVNAQYVSPAYFSVMGIGLDAGRAFSHHDRESSQRVAIVSQAAAARFWPGSDPLGQRIFLNVRTRGFGGNNNADMWVTLVGVVRDVRSTDPVLAPDLDVYLPIFQAYAGDTFFVVRAASVARVRSSLTAAVLNVDPEQSIFDVASMDERIGARVWQRRAAAAVMTTFAVTTLVLVSVGIFGLVSFAVAAQTREIGVRVALGARSGDVRRLVFTQALVPVGFGLALGLPVALAAARTLTAVLFSVSPVDPVVAVGVTWLSVLQRWRPVLCLRDVPPTSIPSWCCVSDRTADVICVVR